MQNPEVDDDIYALTKDIDEGMAHVAAFLSERHDMRQSEILACIILRSVDVAFQCAPTAAENFLTQKMGCIKAVQAQNETNFQFHNTALQRAMEAYIAESMQHYQAQQTGGH